MSMMKNYAEQVSEEMGLGGELTPEVLVEAQRRLDAYANEEAEIAHPSTPPGQAPAGPLPPPLGDLPDPPK